MRWAGRGVLAVGLSLLTLFVRPCAAADDASTSVGQGIYRRGMADNGVPVVASRETGVSLSGAAVACINCHRRSGLGSKEGRNLIPPIAGRYLFHPGPDASELDLPFVQGARGNQEPYDDEKLVRAIREGVDSGGRSLSYLMPRYSLGNADMAALVAYLKRLERRKVPGVADSELHFATIVTPDADPVKRRGMLSVLDQFFAERNARQQDPTAQLLTSGKTSFSKTMFRVNRRWQLHVWELTGAASTWREQLERNLEKQPVFAVIAGLGGSNWAPVHAFCEQAELPCVFPNVEAPPAGADRDFYSLYFTRGVRLEADLIGKHVADAKAGTSIRKVRQIYRAGDVGEEGARALATSLGQKGIALSERVLGRNSAGADGLADALGEQTEGEALVLWLRPTDIAALSTVRRSAAAVYASGLMSGLERTPLPATWREATYLTYPFELPDARRVRVDFALGWFRIRRIPVVAEQVQVDTYLACGLLSETVKHMVDNFVRDYLVERFEDTLEHRIVTGYYPRLSLATGQRFASKGGYLVRFTEPQGPRLVAEQGWQVP
jgi:hypothetical protein